MVDYNSNIELIGVGALFPIKISENDQGKKGWYPAQGDPALIENNLRALVEYLVGQRFRQEEFGTRLWECLEEPNSQALGFMIREFLKQAIGQYEPRITIKKVTTERYYSKLRITMEYGLVGLGRTSYMTLTYDSSTNNIS